MNRTTELLIVGIIVFLVFCKITAHLRNAAYDREEHERVAAELEELKSPRHDSD